MGKSAAEPAGPAIGTGYRVWPDLEADPSLIDPPILPLVRALNATTWVRTVFSCAGHPEEPDSIPKGRRQAHLDVLVSDLPRWHHFVKSIPRPPNLPLTEAPLGPLPNWLEQGVRGTQSPAGSPEGGQKWLGGPGVVQGGRRVPRRQEQHYRRLVFEPTPYNLPSTLCRETLNTALTHALKALQALPQSPP